LHCKKEIDKAQVLTKKKNKGRDQQSRKFTTGKRNHQIEDKNKKQKEEEGKERRNGKVRVPARGQPS